MSTSPTKIVLVNTSVFEGESFPNRYKLSPRYDLGSFVAIRRIFFVFHVANPSKLFLQTPRQARLYSHGGSPKGLCRCFAPASLQISMALPMARKMKSLSALAALKVQ